MFTCLTSNTYNALLIIGKPYNIIQQNVTYYKIFFFAGCMAFKFKQYPNRKYTVTAYEYYLVYIMYTTKNRQQVKVYPIHLYKSTKFEYTHTFFCLHIYI